MLLYTQPYDRGPFEEMQIGSRVDATMGEFWAGLSMLFANNDTMRRTIKLSSSIAHTNGQKLVLAEAFTAEPASGKWQQYPFAMKALCDYMFTQGMNRLTFHRFAHQPHPTALPGMTMGPWGTHFDRTNTWFLKGAAWLKYAARCQALLQQGLFVADLAYLTSEDAPGFTPVRPQELEQTPPEGYDYDLINAETVLKRVEIKNGRITLPDGMSYSIMVLSSGSTMTLKLLKQLHSLVTEGMVLVGPRPLATPGLTNYKDAEFTRLANELWGSAGEPKIVGKGKVFNGTSLRQVLNSQQIRPDFEFSAANDDAPINYIHKTISGADVYFVANRRRVSEDIVAAFRINGRKPEIWNPDTGAMIPVNFYDIVDGRIHMPLQLDPSGSLFVVFRMPDTKAKRINAISLDGISHLNTVIRHSSPVPYNNVTNSFSILLWIKPEIDIALGRKQLQSYAGRITTEYFAIYPPGGEKVYGKGHATTGLTAGRNGIVLWEREGIDAIDVLVVEIPVSGWTHLAIVYKDGVPLLYVNGMLSKEGSASGKIIHPGLNYAYQRDGAMYYNGDMTAPQLLPQAVEINSIQQLVKAGPPVSAHERVVDIAGDKNGILFFKNGNFTWKNGAGNSGQFAVAGLGQPIELNNDWTVAFPSYLGAPPQITLDKLISLHKHPEDGIKFFSGTATYTKKITIPATALAVNKRLFLDLGRVEVLAEVEINGKMLDTLWKPPYKIDITGAVKTGVNFAKIAVTNLWPNRLIGDENLPEEAEYVSSANAGPYSVLSNGAIQKLPGWYAQGKPKPPGGRITFTTWKHYNKDSPLLESGLIGPVTITAAIIKQL